MGSQKLDNTSALLPQTRSTRIQNAQPHSNNNDSPPTVNIQHWSIPISLYTSSFNTILVTTIVSDQSQSFSNTQISLIRHFCLSNLPSISDLRPREHPISPFPHSESQMPRVEAGHASHGLPLPIGLRPCLRWFRLVPWSLRVPDPNSSHSLLLSSKSSRLCLSRRVCVGSGVWVGRGR